MRIHQHVERISVSVYDDVSYFEEAEQVLRRCLSVDHVGFLVATADGITFTDVAKLCRTVQEASCVTAPR